MSTLRELLEEELPKLLPKTPDDAINGTELIKRAKKLELLSNEKDVTLRQYFSAMAADSTSVLAKRSGKHGYYLRAKEIDTEFQDLTKEEIKKIEKEEVKKARRDEQREEKFRSIFMRYTELDSKKFAMKIEHTKSKREEKGLNKWKYPDVIVVNWEVGELKGQEYKLSSTLLEVRKSLGEQPFKLSSIELKTELKFSNFRENFFQCLSNSKWAHSAQLVIASEISDSKLEEELSRLGKSYDVTIISYGIDLEYLDSLPDAQRILKMSQERFEEMNINIAPITTGKERESLDWEHIRDLRQQNDEFKNLFDWISKCLSVGKAYKYDDFMKLKNIEEIYV